MAQHGFLNDCGAKVYTFFDEKYSDSFGLRDDETLQALVTFDQLRLREEAIAHYGGYPARSPNETLIHPNWLYKAINRKVVTYYRERTDALRLMFQLASIPVKMQLWELVEKGTVQVPIYRDLNFASHSVDKFFWSFVYHNGLITHLPGQVLKDGDQESIVKVKMTNLETKEELENVHYSEIRK